MLNKLINAYRMYCPNILHPPFLSYFSMIRFGSDILVFEGTPFKEGELHFPEKCPFSLKCFETWVILKSFGVESLCS